MPRFEFFDHTGDQGLTVFAPHGVDETFAAEAVSAGRPDQTLVTVIEASPRPPQTTKEHLGDLCLANANR